MLDVSYHRRKLEECLRDPEFRGAYWKERHEIMLMQGKDPGDECQCELCQGEQDD